MKVRKTALILLGGMGTRVQGRAKYLFEYQGESFLSRQIHTLNLISDDVILSCRSVDQQKEIEDLFSIPCVIDQVEGRGPVEGIHAGAQAASGEVIYIVACDMPLISAPVLTYLYHRLGTAQAAVPGWENGNIEPLHAVYKKDALLSYFEKMKSQRLRDIIDVLDTVIVPVSDLRLIDPDLSTFTNVNDPESLYLLHKSERSYSGENNPTIPL